MGLSPLDIFCIAVLALVVVCIFCDFSLRVVGVLIAVLAAMSIFLIAVIREG